MNAVAEHRRRLRIRGLKRVELQAPELDAPLLRAIAAALADPTRATDVRRALRAQFTPPPARDFKALLEAAPLDGIELDRPRDTGRDVEF